MDTAVFIYNFLHYSSEILDVDNERISSHLISKQNLIRIACDQLEFWMNKILRPLFCLDWDAGSLNNVSELHFN